MTETGDVLSTAQPSEITTPLVDPAALADAPLAVQEYLDTAGEAAADAALEAAAEAATKTGGFPELADFEVQDDGSIVCTFTEPVSADTITAEDVQAIMDSTIGDDEWIIDYNSIPPEEHADVVAGGDLVLPVAGPGEAPQTIDEPAAEEAAVEVEEEGDGAEEGEEEEVVADTETPADGEAVVTILDEEAAPEDEEADFVVEVEEELDEQEEFEDEFKQEMEEVQEEEA